MLTNIFSYDDPNLNSEAGLYGLYNSLASLFWEDPHPVDLGGLLQASVVTKVTKRSQSIVVNVGILDKVELQIVTDLHPGSSELLYPENEISSVKIFHLLVNTIA